MVNLTNRFHVGVRLFSKMITDDVKTECVENKEVALQSFEHFDVMSVVGMSIDYGRLCRFVKLIFQNL